MNPNNVANGITPRISKIAVTRIIPRIVGPTESSQGGGGSTIDVDISDVIDLKIEALLSHVSAFTDGDGPIPEKAPDGVGDRLRMMNAGTTESYRIIRMF